jgi:hypothetical protein
LCAYVAAVLAHPGYTELFEAELETPSPRVPITRDGDLFREAVELDSRVVWLQTFGQRFSGNDRPAAEVPQGQARSTKAISQDPMEYPREFFYDRDDQELRVGDGVFAPGPPEVGEYEVSGLVVIDSWLGYRMRERAGRTSSELDQIQPGVWTPALTDELLEVLWILEALVELEPLQADLLERVVKGPLFTDDELPELDKDSPARDEPKPGTQCELAI